MVIHLETKGFECVDKSYTQLSLACYHGNSVTHPVWVASGYLNCLSVEVNN